MSVRLEDGWVRIGYDGSERARVLLAVGDQNDWRPAYFHWSDGQRVVQVRPPAGRVGKTFVWLSVDGQVTKLGTVQL
ncbi:hypothetical protein ABZ215_38570 [Amycolatopsis sp. NPDC006131]|uniref:hypothetical protein n=1 Tax=Amycolatopsis sp. NPDC006131 TaxID=3156731 RepID=UPI0033A2241C